MFLKLPMESSGSRRSSGSEFQNAGEVWKKPRGQLSLFSFEGRWEDAPGAGLNAVLGEWMISAPRRNSQRGMEEPNPWRHLYTDEQADLESHPTLNVEPMQLPVHAPYGYNLTSRKLRFLSEARVSGRWGRRKFDRISNSSQQSQTICFSSQIHASSHQSKTPWWLRMHVNRVRIDGGLGFNPPVPLFIPLWPPTVERKPQNPATSGLCYSSTNFLGQLFKYRVYVFQYRIPRDLSGYLGWF